MEETQLGDLESWEDNIKMGLKQGLYMWAGFSWLMTRSSGGLVCTLFLTFGFHTRLKVYRAAP